ncbi:MtrAB system histidine kinase MtrB [Solicola gregarius]|uniref:Sensor histidine kinase MtrB n=1 Tax=Solicola gregarius TaxID=2908642 RepID=A0AA46TF21_9ACTN|nr:MtrAB system histidine kinase MtrB [Solicola gregarius]UYM04045.1 MtrAB system histidine kinase MtrB [Solicola gregarius]
MASGYLSGESVGRLRTHAVALLRRVFVVVTRPFVLAVRVWRRSVQARVVIGTLVLCSIVIGLVGWVLIRQVAEGLVDNRREAAVSVAEEGFSTAQENISASPTQGAFDESQMLGELYDVLVTQGGSARAYEVVLEGPLPSADDGGAGETGMRSLSELEKGSIPEDLKVRVAAGDNADADSPPKIYWTYTDLSLSEDGDDVPAIAIGRVVQMPGNGNRYSLYYLFSMEEQDDTLHQITSAMIYAGIALVLLVAGVAWIVTRQVVTPVRLARRIAERLAAGRLEERMHVRGEDDIARLGVSFNQMASSLQKQIRQLEELSRVQHRFVSDVSHELRTPLTTVRMAADVLHDARQTFDPMTARSAELLQNELDRFEALLADLLEISRFDAGAARLELERVDLAEVADRVADYYRGFAERHGVTLTVRAQSRPVEVEADVRRIERVVRNLVANAIHYSRSEQVDLLVAGSTASAALAVRDYGIGLRPGEAQLVFNRFWRADPSRVRTSGGTGLGLAISLEDATLHGGWLQAWGEPDRGAQFRLTLPRHAGEDVERSPLPLVPADAGTTRRRMTQVGVDD